MDINYVSFILIMLAGFTKGLMDLISFRYYFSIFRGKNYWNPAKSWSYKWKNGDYRQGERFKYSSTALVFLTDGWHLLQWVMISFIALGVIFYRQQISLMYILIDFVILRFCCWQLGFWIAYESKLLKR